MFIDTEETKQARLAMVQNQLAARGIRSPLVLKVMASIPRHFFVPKEYEKMAYEDRALPIGYGQTISQPFMVAAMTESLEMFPGAKVLEIGTGSGYQAAVLSALQGEVTSVERIEPLSLRAKQVLSYLGFHPRLIVGDGTSDLPEGETYDRIIVTAAAPSVPEVLLNRLREGGILVIPVGDRHHQVLKKIQRTFEGFSSKDLMYCVFVPLIGKYGFHYPETC